MAILCASRRTDLPACYWDWFCTRYHIGWLQVRNPHWQERVSTYDLAPDATQGFQFMSKDYGTALRDPAFLRRLVTDHPATTFQATLTPYNGTRLQPGTRGCNESIATIARLSQLVGARRVTWLLGPLLAVDGYVDAHFAVRFLDYAVPRLAGRVATVLPSDLSTYAHVMRRAPWLRPFSQAERDLVWGRLAELSRRYGLVTTVCPQREARWPYEGICGAPCASREMLSALAGTRVSGARDRCGCVTTRDIVGYVPCALRCVYCYAHPAATDTPMCYDPSAPMLLDALHGDELVSGRDVLDRYGAA